MSGVAPSGHRLPRSTRLGPVTLQVADLRRSEQFYGRVLGLEAAAGSDGRSSLRAPGGPEPLVKLVERVGAVPAAPRGRLGLYHYALLLPDRASLGRFAVHAGELGIRAGMSDHRVSEALYLSDPDGHGIEVYADRPVDAWQWRGRELVMTTEPLDLPNLIRTAPAGSFTGLPEGTVVGHVHLHVGDLERGATFYHEGLGFDKVVWSYPGALFLSAGGYHHHVGINTWAAGAPAAGPADARLLSWTLVLPTRTDLERVVENLEDGGHPVRRHGGRFAVDDPWGTAVELVGADALGAEGRGAARG